MNQELNTMLRQIKSAISEYLLASEQAPVISMTLVKPRQVRGTRANINNARQPLLHLLNGLTFKAANGETIAFTPNGTYDRNGKHCSPHDCVNKPGSGVYISPMSRTFLPDGRSPDDVMGINHRALRAAARAKRSI